MKLHYTALAALACALPFVGAAKADSETARVLSQAVGDLDKDGIDEKAIVLDLGVQYDDEDEHSLYGSDRQILLYKNVDSEWRLWRAVSGGVAADSAGGAMGDPFVGISIQRGALVLEHFGGASRKWHSIHRFRLDKASDQFELIGFTGEYSVNIGCDGQKLDYNLSTGRAIYQTINDYCDEESLRTNQQVNLLIPVDAKPKLTGFVPGINEVKIEPLDTSYYY